MKRKFYVTVMLSNPLLRMGKLENFYDSTHCFIVALEDGQKANHRVFKNIILEKNPTLLDYPTDKTAPKSNMKIIAWSQIEE